MYPCVKKYHQRAKADRKLSFQSHILMGTKRHSYFFFFIVELYSICIFFCIGLILRYFVQIHGANDSIDLTVYQRIDPSMTKVMQVMLIMLMQQILTSGQQMWTLDLNEVSTVAQT